MKMGGFEWRILRRNILGREKLKKKRDIIRKQEEKRDKYRYKTNYKEIKNF